MKKILVVLTGGTIGSMVEGKKIDINHTAPYRLLELYEEKYGRDHTFEVLRPFSVLSENMNLKFLNQLCQTMWNIAYENYEGVIVTHGSDTLSYTSALLGMLLCHVQVPVILTASNYPLGEKGSNGLDNFRSAVELIDMHFLRGVFSVYQNHLGENEVYLATRLTEADAYLDQFGSFGGVSLGKVKNGVFLYHDHGINPSLMELKEERPPIAGICPKLERPILMIRAYPGLDYRTIDLSTEPAAALHCLYHSGTACMQGENHSILEFMARCKEMGIPVYTASSKSSFGKKYVTADEIRAKGAICLENISVEAAYAKLLLLYNMGIEAGLEERMKKRICFETLPSPGI